MGNEVKSNVIRIEITQDPADRTEQKINVTKEK
jgi:hypothetical protein